MCQGLRNGSGISRRHFLETGSFAVAAAGIANKGFIAWGTELPLDKPLAEFSYGDVSIASEAHEAQLMNTHSVLMALSEDSLLKPFRQMSGMRAPGEDLGGWYNYDPNYDYRKGFDEGFAPACTFGQWISALARTYAITGEEETRQKVLRLNRLYAETITADFYLKNRFPAYTYDKLLLGLMDSHMYVKDPQALAILEHTTNTALPCLPGQAIEHDHPWRTDKDPNDASWTWDESYTLPENLLLASQRGLGKRYYDLGLQYLDDKTWFDPLSRNENVLNGRHAYSHVNSLSSAMMAYLVAGSQKHLRAAQNAFRMLQDQSFATGGWGPDETLRAPGSNDVFDSLTKTHHSFETPCGSYAHFKLTRYLLRVTRDSRYGDSMERMMYNTVLGAMPLEENGRNFYYADYNFDGKRVYKEARWACCSGTLPQVAADYRINTYFRGPQAVYVNLYIPSTLRWSENGAVLSLTQEGEYPYEDHVAFAITASRPTEYTIHFRIPEWARGAEIHVNGSRQKSVAVPGQFAAIRREWRNGDRVELEFPLTMRLEAINAQHADTVALLRGPLVLMAVKPEQTSTMPKFTREQLLAARRVSEREWQAAAPNGPVSMRPFTWLGSQPYTTYVKLSESYEDVRSSNRP
jgi:uncharacterized protein